jgi:integrase
VNGSLVPLRGILDRAVLDGVIAMNPARGRGIELADETPEMRYLTRDDVAAYLDACLPAYRPLAELLISTGLRLGEALGLEWRDIDFDASALRVTRALKLSGIGSTKTDKPRIVYVDKILLEMLREHRKATGRAHGLVFTTAIGTPLMASNIRRRWHRPAVLAAGLDPALRVHDLRYTYGTLTTASGAGMHFAGAQLGHLDPRSTMRYLHVDPEAHRDAAERAGAWRRRSGTR